MRGFKGNDIAEILHVSPATVSNTINSELGMRLISELRGAQDESTKKHVETIKVLTGKALNVFHQMFDDANGEVGLKDKAEVAKTVLLELSGHRVPTKVQSSHISTILTAEELEEFKQRGIAAARESGLVIDVPAEPEQLSEEVEVSK